MNFDRSPLLDPLQKSNPAMPLAHVSVLAPNATDPTPRTAVSTAAIDVLWRNSTTGADRIGSMPLAHGNVLANQSQSLRDLPAEPDQNWQVVGIADFNHDRQSDLLWRNFRTGAVRIWQIDQTSVQTIALDSVNDFDWRVVGLADFDRDGSIDILWQNTRSEEAGIWFLDRTTAKTKMMLGSVTAGGWRIQGIADFNRDQAPDLVWDNFNTGQIGIWLLNNGKRNQDLMLDANPNLDWKLTSVGDFNGDRSSDLFWRNTRSGETQFWLYDGTTRSNIKAAATININWTPISATDLNGDQTTDLLWRNTTTGELLSWTVQGAIATPTLLFTETDLAWQPLSTLDQSRRSIPTLSAIAPRNGTLIDAGSLSTAEGVAANFLRHDQVDIGNSSDFYRFSVEQSGIFAASLGGLSGDADVRLIQDANGNGTIDTGEVLAWQWERSTKDESIRRFIGAGTYYVQVLSYNKQSANYTLATSFTPAASDDQQFQINLSFADSLSGLSTAARDAIAQAAKFWESVIVGRSAITRSNTLSIALVGENLLYQDGTPDTGTLALSGPIVALDAANLVITQGSSTLNSRKFAEFNTNPVYLRDVMIHEFGHVLGFGTIWEPIKFAYTDGRTVTGGQTWIDRASATYRADSYAGMAYGDLLGTAKPTAIPIEPQIFFHWDETRFDTELMTPFAELPGTLMPMNALTLGTLRDLGWNVNFGAAQPYSMPALRNQPAGNATKSAARQAALKCSCVACRAAARTEVLSPSLSDAVGSAA